jgi:hypothetical protein
MYKKILYLKAYRILENSTPLKFDCGRLCGSKCCKGDNNKGMQLFPGEDVLLTINTNFLNISKRRLNDIDVQFAVCNGSCIRKLRPLSCRIYPLVPYIAHSGKLSIVKDPRAKYSCPLLLDDIGLDIDRLFVRKVYKVFKLLEQDIEIQNYIYTLSRVLDDYAKFTGLDSKI